MIEDLFGNQSVKQLLLYLFVHGRCYGTEVAKRLGVALTPLQKALYRLERGEIISSAYEGKTKIFQLNAAYPLHEELELLLKKAYLLLPSPEKRLFSYGANRAEVCDINALEHIWKRLGAVRRLTTFAKSRRATGDVRVVPEGKGVLVFHEKGSWKEKNGPNIDFSNVFRWKLEEKSLSLEHLRRGIEHPVFLLNLVPDGAKMLTSACPHLCGDDVYFGRVVYEFNSVKLKWRVIGPKKNEELETVYNR